MMLNTRLLEVLACPQCKGGLKYLKSAQLLCCPFDRLAFPIEDGVPVMLVESARPLSMDEVAAL